MFLFHLVLLLPLASAKPQGFLEGLQSLLAGSRNGGRSLEESISNIINNPVIQNRVLNSDLNPCQGELPTNCICDNNVQFQPASFIDLNQGNPCGRGGRPEICTCPKGNSFRADEVADSVASRYNLPNCGQGVEPTNCQCSDGSSFSPSGLSSPPCGGRPLNIKSCSCPNGETITANSFISAAVPLIQDLLG